MDIVMLGAHQGKTTRLIKLAIEAIERDEIVVFFNFEETSKYIEDRFGEYCDYSNVIIVTRNLGDFTVNKVRDEIQKYSTFCKDIHLFIDNPFLITAGSNSHDSNHNMTKWLLGLPCKLTISQQAVL